MIRNRRTRILFEISIDSDDAYSSISSGAHRRGGDWFGGGGFGNTQDGRPNFLSFGNSWENASKFFHSGTSTNLRNTGPTTSQESSSLRPSSQSSTSPLTKETASTITDKGRETTTTSATVQSTSPPVSDHGSNTHRNTIIGITAGTIAGLAIILLIVLLIYWRKKKSENWTRTTAKKKDNQIPTPYDLKQVAIFPFPRPQSNPTPEPILPVYLPPNEKYPPASQQHIRDLQYSSSLDSAPPRQNEPDSNQDNNSAPSRTRSRTLSESSVIRVASITSQSALTPRQLNIQSEVDNLRMQINALQQTQQTLVGQDSNLELQDVRNTLAVIAAHVQRLDQQFDSDWARGLTNEAPPEYCDARGTC
ncbi:hypothetical protein VKT23_018451 [Stygiomarasmius scandens]|uniref:Uncharacterized protein n=1 Tax=Marasmiellus scandens TaxID=2682957 RepID=A0ABR1IS87_9AGAR